MSHQILKDRNGRRIGEIRENTNGKLEIRDAQGRRIGQYDPVRDVTVDQSGRKVGNGNLLTMLLSEAEDD